MLLRKHGKEDLNTKSAFLHMLQDALASLVVMISALFYKQVSAASSIPWPPS